MTATCLQKDGGEDSMVAIHPSPAREADSQPVQTADVPPVEQTRGAPLGIAVRLTVPGADYTFEGVLEHFFGGEASILLDHRFQKDTHVKVEFRGFQFDGDVLFCERKGDRFDTHVVLADQDETGLRRDPRYIVNLAARIHIPGAEQPLPAKLVDISREGIGVESDWPFKIGDTIAVESQLNLAFGIVRHCRQLPTGAYRAGLQVHAVIAKEEAPLERQQHQPRQKKQPWIRSVLPHLSSGAKGA